MKGRTFICNRTAEAFLKDTWSDVLLLFGPVGTGKSSACCVKIWMLAHSMPPGFDGIKRCRVGVVRKTYSQLSTTTVRTWQEWFPGMDFGDVKGDSPMTHVIKSDDFELEVVFLAVEKLADIDRLKSFEFTAIYVNEAQFFEDPEILNTFLERTNRYPGPLFGGGLGKLLLFMDCNPPSKRHWIYTLFEQKQTPGFAMYKLPAAILKDAQGKYYNNPEADYIKLLGPDKQNYWLDLARLASSEEYIRTQLMGEYGIVEGGLPVHPEFRGVIHKAQKIIKYNPMVQVGLGIDFGNTPACAVVQLMPDGYLCVLQEYWCTHMSVREFFRDIVIPGLDKDFKGWRNNYTSVHDPAGQSMNADGGTCQIILRDLGIISHPAASNSLQYRRDALKYFLTKIPGLLVAENCVMISEGLEGKFKYPLIQSTALSGDKQYQETPKKNMWSHICEALEYIASEYASNVKIPAESEEYFPIYSGNFMGI